MHSKVKVTCIYNCTLERAFKTAILSDVSKVHTGFCITPKVTHTSEDEHWGKPGYSKKIFTAPTFLHKGGWYSNDKILERVENDYWKIEVSDFQVPMFGFIKFIGKWKTSELRSNKILIEYSYSLHSNIGILYPFHWLFAKIYWKMYMKRVLINIKTMITNKEPYLAD